MHSHSRSFLTLSALTLLSLSKVTNAQEVFFPNNATINYSVSGDAIVGYDNLTDLNNKTNGTSPTVDLANGGNISNNLYAFNNSTVNISGGTINSVGGTNAIINGVGGIAAIGGTINVSGGTIFGFFNAEGLGTVNIFGTGLSATLINANLYGVESEYSLSGKLQDGTDVSSNILIIQNSTGPQTGGKFTLNNVPEPGTYAILASLSLTCVAFLRRRRKSLPR